MIVLENPHNQTKQLKKALTELQLSKSKFKKVKIELENSKHAHTQKEKQLDSVRKNVEKINKKMDTAN